VTKDEYVRTICVEGIMVDIGMDDPGQQYFYEYDLNGKHYEKGCGAYNFDYIETIFNDLCPRYRELNYKDFWETEQMTKDEIQELSQYRMLIEGYKKQYV